MTRAAPTLIRRASRCRLLLAAAAALALPCHGLEANTATRAELEQLSGLGPAKVQRMLQARDHRPFADWQDLQRRVSGLGSKRAAALSADGLTVNGAPFAAPPHGKRPAP